MITVLAVETPGLGDRSYLAHDGEVALVVDPQRDHDRILVSVVCQAVPSIQGESSQLSDDAFVEIF